MKIGLYSPYLDSLGGGERYLFSVASALGDRHDVAVFWPDEAILAQACERFGFDLDAVRVLPEAKEMIESGIITRYRYTLDYDSIFWVSDGSLPLLFGSKHVLHFQVPFKKAGSSWQDKIKLSRFRSVIVNSKFTKSVIDESFGVDSTVIYPPVDVAAFEPGDKKNVIAALGRFSKHHSAKKQEVLIEAFKKLSDHGIDDWKLVMVGAVLDSDQAYLDDLKRQAAGYRVEFLDNVPFSAVRKVLGEARLFWHAAGFGEDEDAHPERMEHFGIAPVEAQAAGSVPLVYRGGGLKEIVEHRKTGYLWDTVDELVEQSERLITDGVPDELVKVAEKSSRRFSQDRFTDEIRKEFS